MGLSGKKYDFSLFFAQSNDLLIISDTNGYFRKFNPKWRKIFGYTQSELEGKPILEFVHPDDLEKTRAALNKASLRAQNITSGFRHKDGSYRKLKWKFCRSGELFYITAKDAVDNTYLKQRLRKTEERNKLISALTSDYIFEFEIKDNKEINLVYTSHNFKYITGRSIDEVKDVKNWVHIFYPEDYLRVKMFTHKMITNGDAGELECRSIVKGKVRWINIIAKAITKKNSGKVKTIIGAVKDITSRKQIEEGIIENEMRVRSFINESSDGIVITNEHGIIEEWNKSAASIFGFSEQEINGHTLWDVLSVTYPNEMDTITIRRQLENEIKSILKTGMVNTPPEKVFLIRHSKGELKNIKKTVFTIRTEKGYRLAQIIRDVTKQVKTEEALNQSGILTDALLESVPGLVYIYNHEGLLERWNKRHETEMGYSARELYHKSIYEWFKSSETETEFIKNAQKKISQDKVIQNEAYLTKKNGEKRLYFFSTVVSIIEGKKYYTGIGLDITDRKQTEEQIKKNEERLRRAQEVGNIGYSEQFFNENKIWASAEGMKIYGFPPFDGFISIEDLAKRIVDLKSFKKGYYELISGGKKFDMEFAIMPADGSPKKFIHAVADIEKDEKGNPIKVLSTFQDITEQKKAQEALKRREEQIRGISQNIPGMVFQFIAGKDGKNKITYLSNNSIKYIGLDNKNPKGLLERFIEGIAVGDRESFLTSVQKAVETVTPWEWEGRYISPDGGEKYFKGLSQPRILDNNLVFDGIILEITESKKAEILLKESEEKFRIAFNNAPSGMSMIKADGKYVAVNPMLCKMFGYTEEELLSGKINMVTHPDDIERSYRWIKKMIAGDMSEPECEKRYIHKDGHIVWGLVRSQWLRNEDGSPRLSITYIMDITERKKAEDALRKSEEFLAKAQKIAKIGSFELNPENEIGYFSNELYNIFGLDPKKGIPKFSDFLNLIHPEDRNLLIESNKREDFSPQTIEYRSNPESGPIHYFKSNNEIHYNIERKTKVIVGTIQDITEHKRIEAEIRKLNQELELKVEERTIKLKKAVETLESFAYSVSHDLRAPIRHIKGFLKLLYPGIANPDEQIVDYYNKIEISLTRMSSMIDNLLSFSRLGRKELTLSTVDLNIIFKEIIDELKPDIEKRVIEWDISSYFPKIECDRELIKLVFENLLSNAIKYTSKREKAIIKIGYEIFVDNTFEIFIKDNGVGFDMAYANKLFGVFQRLHKSTEYEGVGIGLANVKQIIEKHKGTVRAESKLNEGATFFIRLTK